MKRVIQVTFLVLFCGTFVQAQEGNVNTLKYEYKKGGNRVGDIAYVNERLTFNTSVLYDPKSESYFNREKRETIFNIRIDGNGQGEFELSGDNYETVVGTISSCHDNRYDDSGGRYWLLTVKVKGESHEFYLTIEYEKIVRIWWNRADENIQISYNKDYEELEEDVDDAIKEVINGAQNGNAEDQYYLGSLYFTGKGLNKNISEAIRWFTKSAQNGNVEAQFFLGSIYYTGEEVNKDLSSSFKWLEKAAFNENPDAQYYLGNFYMIGEGVKKDIGQAIKWFEKSIQNGSRYASGYLAVGIAYDQGEMVTANKSKAIDYYQEAILIDPKLSNAYFNLGLIYYNNGEMLNKQAFEVSKDDDEIFNKLVSKSNQEFAKAKPYFEKYLELKPDDIEIKTALNEINRKIEDEVKKVNRTNVNSNGLEIKPGKSIYRDIPKKGCVSGDCENGYGVYRWSENSIYEGEWKYGEKNGQGISYFVNGDIYKGDYKNNERNGQGSYFFTSGNIYSGNWVNGIKDGQGIMHYASGLKYEGNYKTGKQDGFGTYYYANGKIESKGNFFNGEKNGVWEVFTDEGDFKGKESFLNGEKNGKLIYYYPNGQISYEGIYKNGSRDGVSKWYYPNGNLNKIIEYKYMSGMESGLRWNALESFNLDGSLRNPGSLFNGNGTLISYDDSGKVSYITEYKEGIKIK